MSVPTRTITDAARPRAFHGASPRLLGWWRARGIDVAGFVTEEGVCAERAPGDAAWTLRMRLSPWSQVGAALTDEALEIEWQAGTVALAIAQRDWAPGCHVRARVRLADAELRATLLQPR